MSLNDKAEQLVASLETEHNRRRLPKYAPDQGWLDLSSNDYLGLSRHPEVIASGKAYADTFGAGSTGSRLLSGNLPCFEALEDQVAHFKQTEAALVFSTGYQANSSALAALLANDLNGGEPVIFSDRLIHASLHHACTLAGLKQHRFKHNDLNHLRELLVRHAEPNRPSWIITETVFGMDGDLCPVMELAEIACEFDACVYLDEAHATGVFGPQGRGLGTLQSPAIEGLKRKGQWVVMGTFSKAVGVSGAYLACSATIKSYLLNRCNGFVYSTAMSPFAVGAVAKALQLIPEMDEQRARLLENASKFRNRLSELGLNTGSSESHIVPVILGPSEQALALKNQLQQQGIVASAVRPPTVPKNTARLRMALNAQHTHEQLQQLAQEIANWTHAQRNAS